MLATKRYEYLPIDQIQYHHTLTNHRDLDQAKVAHLEKDIVSNGLFEPLVVWERNSKEYYLVGGFHRMEAIQGIRRANPGYFDRVDVRIVTGDPDEIKALNLKLNSDRVDTRITDYFQTVIYLNNANWPKERIAEFFDKSISWIEDIIRYAPLTTEPMREKLASGELSWARAREILRKALQAPPGNEKEIIENELTKPVQPVAKPLPFQATLKRLSVSIKATPKQTFKVSTQDLYSLLLTLRGKNVDQADIDRVRKAFPMLWDEEV
ncbi:MAG: ParB/RepB/Spo0J family partition protein [Methylomonas sp.]|jgi:ParB-like chromosome segregation protein Spo0J|uniref:ParB/RepB/Spo0J family partition protein n=1 Tax=Methylomonas sp. TaxID=418 RepID=UPI0025F34CF9|nr:ParB/RepB/Spo0J family partition protein [Methylomonas sp.]MCK9605566.1 ParB/RepB/Spo0J family partition protein [Methylomonas sp.]